MESGAFVQSNEPRNTHIRTRGRGRGDCVGTVVGIAVRGAVGAGLRVA